MSASPSFQPPSSTSNLTLSNSNSVKSSKLISNLDSKSDSTPPSGGDSSSNGESSSTTPPLAPPQSQSSSPPPPQSQSSSPPPPESQSSSPPPPESQSGSSPPPPSENSSSPPTPDSKSSPPPLSPASPPPSPPLPSSDTVTPPPTSSTPAEPDPPPSSPPPPSKNEPPPPPPPPQALPPPIFLLPPPSPPPPTTPSPPPEEIDDPPPSPPPPLSSPPPPPPPDTPPTSSTSPPPNQTPSTLSPPLPPSSPPSPLSLSPPNSHFPPTAYPPPALPSRHSIGRPPNSSPGSPPSPSPSPPSNQNSPSPPTNSGESSNPSRDFVIGAIAGSVAAITIVVIAVILLFLRRRRKKMNSLGILYNPPPKRLSLKNRDMVHAANTSLSPPQGNLYPSFRGPGYHPVQLFTYEELKELTNGFSPDNLLGEGGFGCVYKGCLQDGKMVAVKQLKVGGGQGDREFKAEVEIISRVHHRHLVSLVGYAIDEHHRLLVYEYLPNRTLEYHLHGKNLPVMEWSKRVKIAIGSARGLGYLHEDCHPRIIHRDIKSANILLDDSFEAQVADFGLARLTNDTHSHVSTRVMGTFGYMAPEYASSGKLTDRSDVFSFGVVLLELITGRRPVDPSQHLGDESLVEWVRPRLVHALETGECQDVVDPRLENNFVKREMLLMIEAAAACVRHAASKRPRMAQVVRALDIDMTDLSNGMKYGQSTIYNSARYSAEIRLFHRPGQDSTDEYSSSYETSGEHELRMPQFSGESKTARELTTP